MFSDEFGLTKLVIEGKKTQTRRISTKPAYKVGEVVAVAERYTNETFTDGCNEKGFSNKMYVRPCKMKHQIRITNIKKEHIKDITESDCIAEGATEIDRFMLLNPKHAFACLFEEISLKGLWNMNPEVWVYEFELVK